MRKLNISDTGARGWFVGDFPEAALNTKSCEVCYRENVTGDFDTHYHTVCTEVILVVKGRVLMNDMIMTAGDIVVLDPGELHKGTCLEPSTVVTIKTPAGGDDKVLC